MTWKRGLTDLQVSLHGNRVGLDKDDYLRTRGVKVDVSAGSTASTIDQYGVTSLSSSSGSFTLEAPMPGVDKVITSLTTSTLSRVVVLASGNFLSTLGSSQHAVNFNGLGQCLALTGLTTALYVVTGVLGCSLSTST